MKYFITGMLIALIFSMCLEGCSDAPTPTREQLDCVTDMECQDAYGIQY